MRLFSSQTLLIPSLAIGLAACAIPMPSGGGLDGGEVAVRDGKADGSGYTECELQAVVGWLNNAQTDIDTLLEAGVSSRTARNLMDHRNGPDGQFGSSDDDLFDNIVEVDDVWWVGRAAMNRLVNAVQDECTVADAGEVEVIFSPQAFEQSHLASVIQMIDETQHSLDIAMYSFRERRILHALENAVARGVQVRVISNNATDDRSDEDGGISGDLEEIGIEVRWINKIMHHKFAIADGVRHDISDAHDAVLMSGSGNWSTSAGTRYDENTIVVRGNMEIILAFQAEFNHLWANGRPFEWNESIQTIESLPVEAEAIPDLESSEVLFTSANFRTYDSSRYGPTFSALDGMNTVSDRLVELIWSAERSIDIASGHLRSRPIAEALIAKHRADPHVDIRILLDGQEYISTYVHDRQRRQLQECLDAAGADTDEQDECLVRGFYFGYQCALEGIDVRYKYYSYRWHYSYAEQMHHKYIIVDERIVATGSYNLSDNAERNTMENMVILDGASFPGLAESFLANFEALWYDPADEQLYRDLMDDVVEGDDAFPLVFEPMTLNWDEITELKRAMREHCPDINTEEFRTNPRAHTVCYPAGE